MACCQGKRGKQEKQWRVLGSACQQPLQYDSANQDKIVKQGYLSSRAKTHPFGCFIWERLININCSFKGSIEWKTLSLGLAESIEGCAWPQSCHESQTWLCHPSCVKPEPEVATKNG